MVCPRCGADMHDRKSNSIARTWALVLAAFIFYIPANVHSITTVISLGKAQADTIMSGVIYFLSTGIWPIALVIFLASIFIPLMKLLILTFLLISVQRNSSWRQKDRTRLYRITEIIGRWSMVDIFVVAILVALVHLGGLASIDAGPGAIFFGGIAFDTPANHESGEPAEENDVFKLYRNRESSTEKSYARKTRWKLFFDSGVRGLNIGAPVELQGIQIGQVLDVSL
jgi:paraquat-inducible protein A